MSAGFVYKAFLIYLILGQLALLVFDGWLWWNGRETVSAWLREHRAWYDYTLAVAMFMNSLLFIHLFRGGPIPPR